MTVKLLTEHHLEFLSLKGGCTGSSKSTLVKMPHCWKSHVAAHLNLEILARDPFICTMNHPSFNLSHQMEEFIIKQRVKHWPSSHYAVYAHV